MSRMVMETRISTSVKPLSSLQAGAPATMRMGTSSGATVLRVTMGQVRWPNGRSSCRDALFVHFACTRPRAGRLLADRGAGRDDAAAHRGARIDVAHRLGREDDHGHEGA